MSTNLSPAAAVFLERDLDYGWCASIGDPDPDRGRTARGPTPVRALLNLVALLRLDGWYWDEAPPPEELPASPNVIVLRATGPGGFATWHASGAGSGHPLMTTDSDPAAALAAFALAMRPTGYILDAEFHRSPAPR